MKTSTAHAFLISVDYRCRFVPDNLSEIEQRRETAALCTSHLASLGKLLARLTDNLTPDLPDLPATELKNRTTELFDGLNVLGQIISAIGDQAVGAVDELIEEIYSLDNPTDA